MKNKCHACGICCMETEMPLSKQDISIILERIEAEIRLEDFSLMTEDGHYQLKNINNQCFFFDNIKKKCSIYEFRPRGCSFYPLVFDLEKNKCVLDEICPRKNLFVQEKPMTQRTCEELKNFLKKDLKINLK